MFIPEQGMGYDCACNFNLLFISPFRLGVIRYSLKVFLATIRHLAKLRKLKKSIGYSSVFQFLTDNNLPYYKSHVEMPGIVIAQ